MYLSLLNSTSHQKLHQEVKRLAPQNDAAFVTAVGRGDDPPTFAKHAPEILDYARLHALPCFIINEWACCSLGSLEIMYKSSRACSFLLTFSNPRYLLTYGRSNTR